MSEWIPAFIVCSIPVIYFTEDLFCRSRLSRCILTVVIPQNCKYLKSLNFTKIGMSLKLSAGNTVCPSVLSAFRSGAETLLLHPDDLLITSHVTTVQRSTISSNFILKAL